MVAVTLTGHRFLVHLICPPLFGSFVARWSVPLAGVSMPMAESSRCWLYQPWTHRVISWQARDLVA